MRVPPPPDARADPLVERLGGIDVADPYRWLEDGDSPESRTWVDAHNRRTRAALDSLPARAGLHRRLEQLLRAPSISSPHLAGDRLFTRERGGRRDQTVLVVRSAVDPQVPARTLIDPGATDATVALDWFHPSPDGALVAYGTSEAGDERSTLRVLDAATGEHRPDVIAHTRAASVAWLADGTAFAYTRYPDPSGIAPEEAGYHRSVWWHRLGHDPATDELVWGDDDMPDPTAWPHVSLSRDDRWLLVHVSMGWSRVDVHLVDRSTGERTAVIEGEEAVTSLQVVGDRLYGTTTLGAPRGRVVTAHVATPQADQWKTFVAESDAVIEGVAVAGESLLVASTEVAVAQLHRYRLDGTGDVAVELPGLGNLAGLDADPDEELAFVAFSSFARPPGLWRWTPAGLEPWEVAAETDAALDPDDYEVHQVSYPSIDGVEVPLFLVHRSTIRPTPDTPVVLTGYGGFAIANGPAWSPMAVAVADAGGVWAVAGIRGGSEHGEDWHRAGMREHKQQSFADFIAAADWLVAEGLTSRPRLAIRGGSNGGLLVGAALTQRPDLCRAVHCAVPLLDMVRFPHFLIARLWIAEYGDPEVPEELAWLYAWSPYHRVVDGTCYPAVLLTTAESDSRVDPCHARKFAARLGAATACGDEHPVLLRVETRAGHGAGKPVGKQADEAADVLAFLFDQLDVDFPV